MFKKVILALIIVPALFYFYEPVYGITIGPSRFEVSLPPGEIAGADYYVQNETDRPVHVVVEPENWLKDTYNYESLAIEDWLGLDIYEFDLEPKEIKKLKLTITVPADRTGELVAQIFFTSAVRSETGEATGVRSRLGAILYVAVKGTEIVDAGIENINVSKVIENDKEKLKIEINVRNKGNVHLRPTGQVLIKDGKGEMLAELELLSGRATLPNKYQEYDAFLEEPGLKKGKYNVTATINYGKMFDMEKTATLNKSFSINENREVIPK